MKLDICLTEDTLHNIIVTEITDGISIWQKVLLLLQKTDLLFQILLP
jgi:hypothetical protein